MNQHSELFNRAKKVIPGGVHSPVRSFKGLVSTPQFMARGDGAYFYDVEGRSLIDFCMSFGPLILGHNHKETKEAIRSALDNGWSFGASEPYSLLLAEYIVSRIPFIDQIRFVNSGTEAVMTALRLARGKTGRNKILKFSGCYHGHTDSMLIKAGSGVASISEASSKGIPEGVAADTLVATLGDREQVMQLFHHYKDQIAAIIIEPLPANNGLLIQSEDFLHFLREITLQEGALLIFDEVISGFRIGFGGMSERTKIYPDIVTYGKIIGGGLPVGAVAAKEDIMSLLAPLGPVYQAGTLSANPLAMVSGLTMLKSLTPEVYTTLKKNSDTIVSLFNDWFANYQSGEFSHYQLISYESLFWPVQNAHQDITKPFTPLFELLLKKGIYFAPNAYEVGFVSLMHNETLIDDLKKRLWS